MKYPVSISGFENQTIEVEGPGVLSGAKLWVNGQEAAKGARRGQYALVRDDGREATASWKAGLSSLGGVPQLVVDDQVIDVVEPAPWYTLVWSALPIVLIFVGGLLGALFGVVAFTLNRRVFDSGQSTAVKFAITGVITAAAFGLYFAAALLVSSALG